MTVQADLSYGGRPDPDDVIGAIQLALALRGLGTDDEIIEVIRGIVSRAEPTPSDDTNSVRLLVSAVAQFRVAKVADSMAEIGHQIRGD